MCSLLKFAKSKILASLVVALFAVSAFAYDGSVNLYGQLGVHKTQSAQTLGHGGFGIGLFMEGAGLSSMVEGERLNCEGINAASLCEKGEIPISDYIGGNAYPFLALGLSDYFDFALSLPIYGDYLRVADYGAEDNLSTGGWGNLLVSSKLRVPFGEDFPLDLAGLLGFYIATGKTNTKAIYSYGPWVRDPMFLNTTSDRPLTAKEGEASAYTNVNSAMRIGAAITLDFNKTKSKIPLRTHFNYTYRTVLGDGGADFPAVQSISAAVEWTPAEQISAFGEFYNDMPTKWPSNESSTDFQTIALGASFHLTPVVDLLVGAQFLVGDDSKRIKGLSMNLGNESWATYNMGLVPKYMAFGGITIKLFKQQEVVEEEEYRNPDTDEDGVCDPWVSESGRQREFARICTGIDLCPYEPGTLENNGCPAKKEAYRKPDTDGDGICDPWVSEEGREDEFADVCTGIDLCPYEAGPKENNGCPIVEAESAEPTIIFSANPESIQSGKSTTLSWITTDANEVEIEGIGKVQARGTKRVTPTETSSYTITAKGKGGTKTESIEVVVENATAPTAMFSITPSMIMKGQYATLTWMTTDATDVSIDGIGIVPQKGTRKVTPTETTTYTIIAKGNGGQIIETAEIIVEEPKIEAKVNLKGVNFVSGKAELTLNARQVLDGVAEQLLEAPSVKIEIHGHTDNVGNQKSNQDLSERRAKAVVGYLATKGVKLSRMKAVGFGQDVPIADNKTAEGKEINRRIEMIRVDD
ncbi:MAG: OmpA family protein [Fibromonadaceae bacterium]|jgi:outer membrane protein OmpA-like peptidoglycan-associated protein|nr:OmpA family protein [Fibromonadaceae bacterium]